MEHDLSAAFAFGALLRDDPNAAKIYDSCTPAQKQKILLQVQHTSAADLKDFVGHLDAAL